MGEPLDTRPAAGAHARRLLMARSAEERLGMASRMSVGARQLAMAGARSQLGVTATDREVRRLVFLRFYERELGTARAEQIFDAIEARRAGSRGSST